MWLGKLKDGSQGYSCLIRPAIAPAMAAILATPAIPIGAISCSSTNISTETAAKAWALHTKPAGHRSSSAACAIWQNNVSKDCSCVFIVGLATIACVELSKVLIAMRRFPLILVMLLVSATAADVIVLKDGTRLEGDVKRTPDGWTIALGDGSVKNVAPDAVKSIALGSGPKDSQQSSEGLASLRRSVDALSDINQIIDRYQRFIDK